MILNLLLKKKVSNLLKMHNSKKMVRFIILKNFNLFKKISICYYKNKISVLFIYLFC